MSGVSSASSSVKKGGTDGVGNNSAAAADTKASAAKEGDGPAEPAAAAVEGEDTMKNLRKTFAGIFGDLQ